MRHGEESILTLANETFPLFSLMTDSILGVNILHGPHHVAKKSTTIGVFDFRTLSSKSFSSYASEKIFFVIKILKESAVLT